MCECECVRMRMNVCVCVFGSSDCSALCLHILELRGHRTLGVLALKVLLEGLGVRHLGLGGRRDVA